MPSEDTICIHHRVELAAAPAEVYRALTTAEGLSSWWTDRVETGEAVGELAEFSFGGGGHVVPMRIEALEPDRRVVWRCESGGWEGHRFTFDLVPTERGSVLSFTHDGWKEVDDFYGHCSAKWGFFLTASLKPLVEGGTGVPHPHDPRI